MKAFLTTTLLRKLSVEINFLVLPFLLIMILLVLPLPLITCGTVFKTLLTEKKYLYGVANKPHPFPALSGSAIFNKTWQIQFQDWLNFKIPLRSTLIRLHNQIYYSLFSKSYMYDSHIIIGRKNYFYEISYLTKYCNTNHITYTQAQFSEWLAKLQALNDFFRKRRQKFVYIISPSKAGYFPEYIPSYYRCSDAPRPDYKIAQSTLKKADFPYIDASRVLLDNKSKYGNLLFPRGGTHWTALGAALIIADVLNKIDAPQLPRLKFSYTTDFNPSGTDSDLLDISNLLFPQKNYIVPKVSFIKSSSKHPGKPLKIALVGGSFLGQLTQLFAQEKLFAQIDYYFYLKLNHFHMADGVIPPHTLFGVMEAVDLHDPKTYQDILDADVVIFEENEENLRSAYLTQLLDTLKIEAKHDI